MELLIAFGLIAAFFVITTWRKDYVIKAASDAQLMNELKHRAFERKMKHQADAEIEAAVNRAHIPY